jgi:anti-sigma regulatory factor (Ser/Thr protein kinase)
MASSRQLVVPAQHDQLARLASFVVAAATEVGFSESQVNRIELAVDEACSNIIDHAYKGAPGVIQLEVRLAAQQELTIILVDQGEPFDPDRIPTYAPCTSLDEVKIGGLGIHLMRQAMDDVCYEFNVPGVGNRLTMVKRL